MKVLDPVTYIHNQRPDMKWQPYYITNMVYDVVKTEFPMSGGDLPDYILNSKSIVYMHASLYDEKINTLTTYVHFVA